jgi:lysophospholipase L1-like esterase
MAVIGDSITGGTQQGGRGDKGWPRLVTAQLRAQGMDLVTDVGAEGASGYVNVGHGGGVFADKIADRVRREDRLVVFFGSINDAKATPGQMAHATCDTLRSAEEAAPLARLLVIGPSWTNANPPDYVLRSRDILRDRAEALGGKFIDPLGDGWFVDRPDLIGKDGVHPTDAGHEYIASKLRPVIEQELTAPSAP